MALLICGLFGNVGKYKTALATLIVLFYVSRGIPVYTNYTVSFAKYAHLIHKLSITKLLELEVDRGMILIDEVYTIAESRVSTSKVNRFFSYFIFQSRKLHVDIFYTAQLTSSVDLRLYNLTDQKIACFGLGSGGVVKFKRVWDKNGRTKKKSISIPFAVFNSLVFNHYDTYNPVDPLGLLELVVDIEKTDHVALNKRIDESIAKLSARFPELMNSKLTKYVLDDCLTLLGLPLNLSSYVYNRIRHDQVSKQCKTVHKLFQNTA